MTYATIDNSKKLTTLARQRFESIVAVGFTSKLAGFDLFLCCGAGYTVGPWAPVLLPRGPVLEIIDPSAQNSEEPAESRD